MEFREVHPLWVWLKAKGEGLRPFWKSGLLSPSHVAAGQDPTPGEHQNWWYMGVPPQNGGIGYDPSPCGCVVNTGNLNFHPFPLSFPGLWCVCVCVCVCVFYPLVFGPNGNPTNSMDHYICPVVSSCWPRSETSPRCIGLLW